MSNASPRLRALAFAAVVLVALAAAFVSVKAMAQPGTDPSVMRRYGGVLAPVCGDYRLAQLKVLGDTLVVQDRGQAVLTGRKVHAVPAYFGAKPPAGFENALTSDVGGEAMVFVFYREPSGLYAAVEGGPRVLAALPGAFKDRRVRHCDPNRNAAPGTVVAEPPGASDLLRDARFRDAWRTSLGPLAAEPWLADLSGPAPPMKTVRVAGAEYRLASVCKDHDCADTNAVLLVSHDAFYAQVRQRGRMHLVGAPPPHIASELDRLWRAEWRSNR